MDEYQYDELSMAMGFALFSVGLVPPIRPDSDQYSREDLRTIRPSMALKNFRFSGLPAAHSYDSHTGREHFRSVEPKYSEHETHLERFQEENELGIDTETLTEGEEEDIPIIDGNVYPDDEIVKLDLFQRARTGTVIFDGFSANGQLMDDNFILTPRGVGASGSGNNSSNASRKSVGWNTPTEAAIQPSTQPVLPPTPPPSAQAISSPPSTQVTSAPPSDGDAPAVDPKAMLRNMLMGGIANRGAGGSGGSVGIATRAPKDNTAPTASSTQSVSSPSSTQPKSSSPHSAQSSETDTNTPPVDPKAMLRNMLMGGIANRAPKDNNTATTPTTPTLHTTQPATSPLPTPPPTQSSASNETDTPPVDPKAMLRNMLMGGIANRGAPKEQAKPKEQTPVKEDIRLEIEESSKAKKFVFPTTNNDTNPTPTTSRATISTPNSNTSNTNTPTTNTPTTRTIASPYANNNSSKSTPSSTKSTPSNMVISSPQYNNTTEPSQDTWSPRTRELPPLPPFSASNHSSGHSRRNLTPIVEGRESEDNTPAPTPFHMAGSL